MSNKRRANEFNLKEFGLSKKELAEFCRRHHIRKLALFGSVLREGFTQESDLDVLVEFEPGAKVGLIRLTGIEIELSKLLGRKVVLNTPGFLSPYFRESVLRESKVFYDKTQSMNFKM